MSSDAIVFLIRILFCERNCFFVGFTLDNGAMHSWQVPFENTFVQLTSTKKISILQSSTNYDSFLILRNDRFCYIDFKRFAFTIVSIVFVSVLWKIEVKILWGGGEREERRQISKRSNITKATSTWDTILPLEASLSSQFQHRIADFSKYPTTIGPWKKCPWTFSDCPNDENINKRAPSIVETLQKNSRLDSFSIAFKLR